MEHKSGPPSYSLEEYESYLYDPASEGGPDVLAQRDNPKSRWKIYKLRLDEDANSISLHKRIWTGDRARKKAVAIFEADQVNTLEVIKVPDEYQSTIALIIKGVILVFAAVDVMSSFTLNPFLLWAAPIVCLGIFIGTTSAARRTMVPAIRLTTYASSREGARVNLRARGLTGIGDDQELAQQIQDFLHTAGYQKTLPQLDDDAFWKVNRPYALLRDGMVIFIAVLAGLLPAYPSPVP